MCILTDGCFKRRKYAGKDNDIGRFFRFNSPQNRCFSTNVFVKPNEQNRACSSYAMARKRRMKSNVFVKPNEQNRACSSYAMARKRRMKSNFFFVCDTCDSKKTKSLLEGARIYARERLEEDKQIVDTRKQRYEYTEIREYKDIEIREG